MRLDGKSFDKCNISVDGTDCRMEEPAPFNRKWYSFKFKGPGLGMKLELGLQSGEIVWVNGPYLCGSHTDFVIFRKAMKSALRPGEFVVADKCYQDERCRTPWTSTGLHSKNFFQLPAHDMRL